MAIVPYRFGLPVVSRNNFTPWDINLSEMTAASSGDSVESFCDTILSDKLLREITALFRLSLSPMFKLINRLSHFDTHTHTHICEERLNQINYRAIIIQISTVINYF